MGATMVPATFVKDSVLRFSETFPQSSGYPWSDSRTSLNGRWAKSRTRKSCGCQKSAISFPDEPVSG
jgi:hypothetical protein